MRPRIVRRYLVKGRVQGVGLPLVRGARGAADRRGRLGAQSRRRCGRGAGLRNREQLGSLYDRLQEGPRAARIDDVEVDDAAPFNGYQTFQIEEITVPNFRLESRKKEESAEDALKKLIRAIPDYPKPGILFYDITTLIKDRAGLPAWSTT